MIVRDADQFPNRAFASVCSALSTAFRGWRFETPQSPFEFKLNENIRVAVVIVPAANRPGAIEELLLDTVNDDPVIPDVSYLIDQAIARLPQPNPNLQPLHKHFAPPPHRVGKARLHAFLATFDRPDRDAGIAAQAGVWDFNHPALQPLRQILEQM